jgi:uncharacterized protein (TIGR03437 family)
MQPAIISDFAAGDFNGDGKSDVMVLSYATNSFMGTPVIPNLTSLTVFIGNGDGSFQPGRVVATYPVDGGYLNVGDFNGDGILDLVVSSFTGVAGSTGLMSVFLGNGDATFGKPIQTATTFTQRVFVTDLNGDHKLDLLVGDVALIGNGDGTFQQPISFPGVAAVIADINHDGIPDIVTNNNGTLMALIGRGNGTFNSGSPINGLQFGTSTAGSYQSIAAGDFNGDGSVDIAVSQSPVGLAGGQVGAPVPVNIAILLGNGDGTFQAPKVFTGLGGPLLAVDLNQDGKLDLVSDYSVLLGKGDGTFNPPIYLATPTYLCAVTTGTEIQPNGCGIYTGVSLATDLNGDGMPDLVMAGLRPLAAPAELQYSNTSQLSSFLNDSPGDGFLVPGVPATGAANQNVGFPAGSPSGLPVATSPGFAIGQNSLVTACGVKLAPMTASASGPPYPTTLGGISLHIGDSLAPLLYVSPTQINYLAPPGPFFGTFGNQYGSISANPTVSIERAGSAFQQKGIVLPMVPNEPGLFTVDASGVAAATAVRVAPDGTQTAVPVFDCSQSPCIAVPMDLSGDPVYLSLYGTGFDLTNPQGLITVLSCTSGRVTYFGPQGAVPGLNQINLVLGKDSFGNVISFTNTCKLQRNLLNGPNFVIEVVTNPVQFSIK